MPFTFRLAAAADLTTVLSLLAGEESGLTKQQLDAILARIQRYPDYQIWLVEHEATVLGVFTLVIIDGISHGGATMAIVNQIAMRVDAADDEAALASLVFAKDLARQRGCRHLILADQIGTSVAEHCGDLGFTPGPLIIDPQRRLVMNGR